MKPSARFVTLLMFPVMVTSMVAMIKNAHSEELVSRATSAKDAETNKVAPMSCKSVDSAPTKVSLPIGKSTIVRLPAQVSYRTLGNPAVAQAMLVSPETLYLLGMAIGTTNMILQEKNGTCKVIDVEITMDPIGLLKTIQELLPDEKNIRITAAADSLVLSGVVSDALVVAQVVDLATAYVRRPAISGINQPDGTAMPLAALGVQQTTNNQTQSPPRVINLLSIGSAQQVMLEVKIAEVSKTLIDKLGAGVQGSVGNGAWTYSILTQFLTNTLAGGVSAARSTGTAFVLEAEKKDGLIKILAEPNVMAISGQEGSFLAGGKILIPVSQDSLSNRITLEEKEFGVGLKFTPTVLAGGRINLKVSPEVSELSREGVGISNLSNNARTILPLITTRRSSTTVQLSDGESFAIGGLIKNNRTANVKAFPILGELPLIGALFRSTDFQQDRTELVFVVTPRLIKPLSTKITLPTDGHIDPSRSDLFLGGRMEGKSVDDKNSDATPKK